MLRIAIPYGMLSATQLRKLADIARRYDRGYGHFTTRQNMQFNWPRLEEAPDILAELATVEMHAIQTSGNCIRNITTDQFRRRRADELTDPRPYCEIVRQWSTFHPEFAFLPRKFKIAGQCGGARPGGDRAHDIGLDLVAATMAARSASRLRRRRARAHADPRQASMREFLPRQHLLLPRGHPARLQPLRPPRQQVQGAHQDPRAGARHRGVRPPGRGRVGAPARTARRRCRRPSSRASPAFRAARLRETLPAVDAAHAARLAGDRPSPTGSSAACTPTAAGLRRRHAVAEAPGVAPATSPTSRWIAVADLADRFSFGELRVTHEQNVVLADVRQRDLHEVWQIARATGLATPTSAC
jgi:sulfite reductase (NADPH) hemoprotein beta-component